MSNGGANGEKVISGRALSIFIVAIAAVFLVSIAVLWSGASDRVALIGAVLGPITTITGAVFGVAVGANAGEAAGKAEGQAKVAAATRDKQKISEKVESLERACKR